MSVAPRVAVVVLAGGSGARVGAARNKAYLPLAGEPIVSRSLRAMTAAPGVVRRLLVVRPADRDEAAALVPPEVELVDGGATRHDSEYAALRHLAPAIGAGEVDLVLIHDAARPLAPPDLVRAVVATAATYGGAVPGVPATDLVEVGPDGTVTRRLDAAHVRMQTPQAFAAGPLLGAYDRAAAEGYGGTDTAACVQRYTALDVRVVPSTAANLKITVPGDLAVAEALLADVPAEPVEDRLEPGQSVPGQTRA